MKIYLFIPLLLMMSCSRASNPYQFTKVESVVLEEPLSVQVSKREYTLLELYLQESISADEMIEWFFQDQPGYRDRLYSIQSEVDRKLPLSPKDEQRLIVLEYRMNRIIQTFNRRNIFSRATDYAVAAFESRKAETESDEGNPSKIVSDNPMGFLNSFFKNGFTIEEVDFLLHEKSED